ncbi:TonB-dependent receptor [Sphingobacterium psychroaquaticum]|uniref:TonB-dependent receptor n=1 Tax=Sphingobacterium psychroaquaticum TaxID=561061 RepID=UPI001069185F|nr:carboxypeptidase-like regulatory domain-containing protein [Sphingobacterium psychroaquaticum]QBQ40832.1 TonB-dependent receptor [Sphingobacterium psychroaquaticum]
MKKSSILWMSLLAFMLISNASFAQRILTGKVSDGFNPIAGVSVLVSGTQTGTSTDAAGNFALTTNQENGQLEIKFLGYLTQLVKFSKNNDLGTIVLAPSKEQSLDEIVVVGRGVIDIAEGRMTPIAVSTIHQAAIEEKVGSLDITSTLANTPSVYITGQAKGFGESSMNTRGFDQSNTAFLLNGQPINGMDNGRVYWSNWSGLSDIASVIQIQRGLGSSKLAISSVGGTTNFVTKSTDMKKGGFLKHTVGNDMFVKSTLGYNTGLMKNGFAVSAMFTHWQGDGYMNGTAGAGQNYFLSVGYKVNDKHNLNLMVTGAPQWHEQGGTATLQTYLDKGRKYNRNIETINGVEMNPRKNYYHKPVANFNWDWEISDRSSLSTVIYASMARGGGQSRRNDNSTAKVPYLAADVNNHQWYGIVSNYNRKLNDNLTFNVGFDLRDYKGEHYRQVTDLLGANSIVHTGNVNYSGPLTTSNSYSTNPWKTFTDKPKNAEDRLAWDYDQIVRYAGLFGQIEYAKDGFTAFFQGSLSEQQNIREDYFLYKLGEGRSEKVNNFGYNTKGGVSYTLGQHSLFGNAGYYSRQPYQNNIFMNYRNDVNEYAENEKILGLELGYKFASEYIDVNVNAYRTTWENRVTGSSRNANAADVTKYNPTGNPDILQEGDFLYFSNYGVKQDHKGVELDFTARPFTGLEVKGFGSIGDWRYKGNATTIVRNEDRVELATENKDVNNGKVGDAAQTSYGVGAKYSIIRNLSIDADFRSYDRLYSSLQAGEGKVLQLPSYQLFDVGTSYKIVLSPTNTLSFRVNVNNLFDKFYISEATTNTFADGAKNLWNGINTANTVLIGMGRTWNGSIKFTF